ncbi:hypothetical protein [Burkholderia sp. AU32262]|uniref:hypothetical protein n=1 Tax=Burkholderia sp. AU32262 TaxID=2879630 RepID=UPI001CF11829|nr:hypothetical protein [Burkholderia sp. AU32262]MCA8239857.1 hypothetical protein [Burkholderia sp. AU32262]
MAEANSVQMAKVLAAPNAKLQPNETGGRSRIMFGQITSIGAAIADTIYFGRIPAGARIHSVTINNAAGTASSTMSIGVRKASDKSGAVAAGLSAATAISSAQRVDATTGSLVNAGQTYITPYESDVYGTIAGAATPASPGQLISVTVHYVLD